MRSLARVSILVLGAVVCVVGGAVGARGQMSSDVTVNEVPDFETLPGMAPVLEAGKAVSESLLVAQGFVKTPEEAYDKAFAAPKEVVDAEGASMFVGVNVMLITRTGGLPEGGATVVINVDGDRFTITNSASPAAGPSLWSVGDNGMISEVASPPGIPGALTRVGYRSAALDYDLYFYYGAGGAILERIRRKDGGDQAPAWTVAVQQDDVHYLKTIPAGATAP